MLCDGLSDADLDTLIAELTTAYREAILGGGVAVVQGEGRKLEYTAANRGDIKRELAAAQREKKRRDHSYVPDDVLLVEF
jgi:hypothetical protein